MQKNRALPEKVMPEEFPDLPEGKLENIFTAQRNRAIAPVIQIFTEIHAVHIIDRNSVIIPVESIEEIGANHEFMFIVLAAPRQFEALQNTHIGIPET